MTAYLYNNKDVNKVNWRQPQAYNSFFKKLVANIQGNDPIKKLILFRVFIDYNNWIVGIDIHDQLQSYYTTQITTVCTWLPLFFQALNAAIINAYIINKKIFQTSKKPFQTHHHFCIQLVWNLIIIGSQQIGLDKHNTKHLLS